MDVFGTLFTTPLTSATTTLANVILHSSDQYQWELWVQQVKQRAADANIWGVIDPDQNTPPVFIRKPKIPAYADIKPGTTKLSELRDRKSTRLNSSHWE